MSLQRSGRSFRWSQPALAMLLLGLLGLAAPAAASAQVLHGTVRDQDTRAPVPDATVELMTGAGNVVATERSDSAGDFVVRASGPGLFLVRVSSDGYLASPGQFVQLDEGGETRIDVHLLSRPPFELDPIEVSVERVRLALEEKGFYERRERTTGFFLSPEDLERRPPVMEVATITRAPFVYPSRDLDDEGFGFKMRRMGETCDPLLVVDDMEMQNGRVEDFVIAKEIAAIEVYRGWWEVPPELGLSNPMAQVTPGGVRGNADCGLVMIWTTRAIGTGPIRR